MADKQQTLIYIEKENLEEAKFMSRNFVNPEVKKRAYVNALGAELISGYLASEGFDVQNLHNIHSISKILENNDISDILLPNIHIDVRVVVDENQIFVPKSHFEKGLVPDVYAVLKLSEDFKTAEFLGYFTPSQIDKNNANTDYYFVGKNQLTSSETFVKFINDFVGKSSRYLTEEDIYRGRELSVSMADHNITPAEEKEFIELLLLSDSLRESVLEFDNFETLAYTSASAVVKAAQDKQDVVAPAVEITEQIQSEDNIIDESKDTDNFDVGDDLLEDSTNNIVEPLENETTLDTEEKLPFTENLDIAEDLTQDLPTQDIEQNKVEIEKIDTAEEKSLTVDDILDKTIASIDDSGETKPETDKKSDVAGNIVAALAGTAAAASAAGVAAKAETVTTGVTAAEAVGAAVSDEAIKLASLSGDIIDNALNGRISEQNKYIDSVDYDKARIAPDAVEIPEEMKDVIDDLSKSKKQSEEEFKDEYDTPKDMATLDKADSIASEIIEQDFKPETVDMEAMETVENEAYEQEDTDSLSDIEQISSAADNISKSEEEFVENYNIAENEVVDLPEITDFSIDDEGKLESHSTDLEYSQRDESEDLIDIKPLDDSITDSLDFGDESISLNEDIFAQDSVVEDLGSEQKKDDKIDTDVEDIISEGDDENIENLDKDSDIASLLEEDSELAEQNTSETVMEDVISEPSVESDKIDLSSSEEITFEDFENMMSEDTTDEKQQEDMLNSLTEENSNLADSETVINSDSDFSDFEMANLEDIIEESEVQASETFVASSNSTVISDKTFTVGEIPIDINNTNEATVSQEGPLTDLYNKKSTMAGESLLNNPGTMGAARPKSKSPVAGILGTLIVLAIVGVIGFFAAKMFKAPTQETPQPVTDETLPASSDNTAANSTDTLNIDKNNVVNMDNNTNALASTASSAKPSASANNAKKSGTATAFVDIKKLTWEVPDYVSYDANFKQYFQSVGKSLKLALTSDLLLATDYIYSSPVKVSVTFTKDGDFKNSQIINSSGSTQIDSIVLQTVNQTLKGVKAPHSVGNDESTTAILKIYF